MNMLPRNKSLLAKSAARLAAVQLLYRCNVLREAVSVDPLLEEYEAYSREDSGKKGLAGAKPHMPTLKSLLNGVEEHQAALDGLIGEILNETWKRERMNPLALIILQLAFYELDAHRQLSEHVIIDEYTTLAQRFLNEEDIGFIHASLKKMGEKLRH